jgi:short-subunit dehydrogenase
MEAIGIWGATHSRGSGIGRSILRQLAGDPNVAVHVFCRSEEKQRELSAEFESIKGSLVWDLRDETSSERYQQYLVDNGIRSVISTVGVGIANPIPFLTQAELMEMVESNLVAPFMILKHTLLPMKQLNGGRVIMFGSITSFRTAEGASGYSATKMALRGLLESTRRELRMGFSSVSLSGVYSGSISKVGLTSVVEAVSYLLRLPFGVHADVIVD